MQHTCSTYEPSAHSIPASWWRCCLSSIISLIPLLLGALLAALVLVGIGNRSVSSLRDTFFFIPIAALFQLLLIPRERDRLTIIVGDGIVVRPAKNGYWNWPRIQFPIHDIDRERTCKQPTLQQGLFGRRDRYLWSVDGRNIPIDYWAFTPAQIAALLAEIGCSAEQG